MPREIGLTNANKYQGIDDDIDFDFFEDGDKDSIIPQTPISPPKDTPEEDTFESDTESENSLDVTVTETSSSDSDVDSWSEDDSFESLSEDEITDVTPLSSTNASPLPASPHRFQLMRNLKLKKSELERKKEGVKDRGMDLEVLVDAILKLEKEREGGERKERIGSGKSEEGRVKKNMSFSDEQVRKIDRENQLLLKKILDKQHCQKGGDGGVRQLRTASSAVNRKRQQKKIEAENLTLLKRIQSAKPTKELSRQYLLKKPHDNRQRINTKTSCDNESRPLSQTSQNVQKSAVPNVRSKNNVTIPIPIVQTKIPTCRARVRSNKATEARIEWNARVHSKS